MKSLIKIFGASLLFLLAVNFGYAQQRTFDPAKMADRQSNAIITAITSLTDVQKDSVKAINLEFAQAQGTIFKNNNGDRDAARSAFQGLRKDKDDRFKAVFNADQYTQYQEWQKSQRRGGQGGRRGGNNTNDSSNNKSNG